MPTSRKRVVDAMVEACHKRDLLAACRWNLRANRTVQATLTAIAAGYGAADLIQDLNDLAELIDKHQAASAIATGLSGERNDTDQRQTKRLRDRAFTLLDDHISMLREAGRYRFRGDSTMTAKFTSQYRRRRRRAAEAAAKEAAAAALMVAEAARAVAATPVATAAES